MIRVHAVSKKTEGGKVTALCGKKVSAKHVVRSATVRYLTHNNCESDLRFCSRCFDLAMKGE